MPAPMSLARAPLARSAVVSRAHAVRAGPADGSRPRLQAISRVPGFGIPSRAVRPARVILTAAKKESDADDSNLEDVYVGRGKYVKDDPRKYADKELGGLTGGWAGGELRLKEVFVPEVKAELAAKKGDGEDATEKKESDIDLSKDFGGLAGGFPGGEKGVRKYTESGEAWKPKEPASLGLQGILITLAFFALGGYTAFTFKDLGPLGLFFGN